MPKIAVNTNRLCDVLCALKPDELHQLAELLRDAVAEKKMWEKSALERGDEIDAMYAASQANVGSKLFEALVESPVLQAVAS